MIKKLKEEIKKVTEELDTKEFINRIQKETLQSVLNLIETLEIEDGVEKKNYLGYH